MTLSIWHDERISGAEILDEVDVAIIGGGILGAGCAYEISKRQGLKTVLFESKAIASRSTGRSAGFILRGIQAYYNNAVKAYGREKAKSIFEFAEANQRLILDFADKSGADFEVLNCGSYLLASSLDELDDLKASAQLMTEDGFKVEYLKEDPIERDFYGALHNTGDFAVNPVKLTKALLENSTTKVYEHEEVTSVAPSKNGSKLLVTTAKRALMADRVLLTTNAFSPLFSSWFADKLNVVRGQIMVTQPLKKRIVETICYANYGFEYFRQLPCNRLLLGGCRQQFAEEEKGFGDKITKSVQSALESYLKNRFPECAGIPVDYRFSGLMAFTSDGLPLVGELEKLPGLFFAVGCNGHGLGFGINMSKTLVEVALDGEDAGMFAFNREARLHAAAASGALEKGP
ncbi:MAG: FAD-binding oxidoreductase [Leptolyngbya sp.]|nr:FAD-binding oxidoreductase [Candidatus Melainabacteria bacterium]